MTNKNEELNILIERAGKQIKEGTGILYYYDGNPKGSKEYFNKAIDDLNKAYELDHNNEMVFYCLGEAYYCLGIAHFNLLNEQNNAKESYLKSINSFQAALKLNQENDLIFLGLGKAFFELGVFHFCFSKEYNEAINNFKEAIKSFNASLEINTENKDTIFFLRHAYSNLGVCYLKLKEFGDAKENFKKTVNSFLKDQKTDEFGDLSTAYLHLGIAHFNLKEYEDAKESFKKTIEQEKENNKKNRIPFYLQILDSWNIGDAYFYLASSHFNLREYTDAEKSYKQSIIKYKKAFEYYPEKENYVLNLGIAYLNLGKTYSNLNKHKDAGENYNNAIEKLCKAYSFKSKDLNPFIINSLLTFINKDDKDYLLFNFTDKLKDIDSFFIDLICRYQEIIKNKNEEEQRNYKKLLYSIYDLFESLRLNEKNDDKYIYHYTQSIVNNQKLCLYSKESKENKTFFDFLKKKAEEKTELKDFIEKISQYKDTNIFTNSLTQSKDNITLENDNEIAIKAKKFNKTISGGLKIAQGKKTDILFSLYSAATYSINSITKSFSSDKEKINDDIPIENLGLYKVLYLSKDDNLEKLNKIYDCLNNINKEDLKNKEIINLIASSLMPLKYLIKDESFSHEKEVILMYLPGKNFILLIDEKGDFYIEA